MKIILSRKGFDSSNGGSPSPIFPLEGGTFSLYSLPIALQRSTCEYADIQWNGTNLQKLIESLRRGCKPRVPADPPHLDPDLVRDALRDRHSDWRPIFGQSGAQESQLRNMFVDDPCRDPGNRPLFLFFGWFKETNKTEDTPHGYTYVDGAPDIHALFGWLQVEQKIILTEGSGKRIQPPERAREQREQVQQWMPWAAEHPHIAFDYYDIGPVPRGKKSAGKRLAQSNAIYVAPKPGSETDRLILDGRDTGLPASGMFHRFDSKIHTLTSEGRTRSVWRLPRWFWRNRQPLLGMHTDPNRWKKIEGDGDHIILESVGRGQEFVFDSNDHPKEQVLKWVESIVSAGQPPKEK
ncbi:MAG: hypothetical protein ACLQOO_10425 [Terriglobia bacterium]